MNICNIDYDNELNNRINVRWFPSNSLPPQFDERPVSTKYTFFQTVEEKPIHNTPLLKYNNYTPENTFNPGSRAPTNFFLNNIDTESKLRNQFMALQKSNKAAYVPELTSSLYENSYAYKKDYTPTDCKTNINNNITAPNTFNNFTRYNLRK
jgi:hypothetical protein